MRGDRDRAGAERLRGPARAPAAAAGGDADDVGAPPPAPRDPSRRGATTLTRSRSALRTRERRRPVRRPRSPPPSRARQAAGAAPAGRGAARPAPREAVGDPHRRDRLAGSRPGHSVGRGARRADAARRAREEALEQLAGRRSSSVRASSRPKKISTSGRATWVESTRSVGSWKLPTLSEREWRSAADEGWARTDRGRGRCRRRRRRAGSRALRLTSSGTGAARGRGPRGSGSPGRPRAPAGRRRPAGPSVAAGVALSSASGALSGRGSAPATRGSAARSEGAAITTRWPRVRQLGSDPGDELVDLVGAPQRVRCHVGDRGRSARGGTGAA